jgi:hypothetical protein
MAVLHRLIALSKAEDALEPDAIAEPARSRGGARA